MEGEKIYCMDRGCDATTMALMNNNNMNNPMWLIWLLAMRWLNGDGNYQNNGIESLRNQIADNKNSSDMLMALQNNSSAMQDIANRTNTNIDFVRNSICQLKSAITEISGKIGFSAEKVINATLLGNKDITAMMQQCCCENKLLVTQQGYENRIQTMQVGNDLHNRIDTLGAGMTKGFADIGFLTAQQTCELKTAANANTQRIIDTLNAHWQEDLKDKLATARLELSQKNQNEYLVAQMKAQTGCGCN